MTGDVFPKKNIMSDTCRYVQYFLHQDNLQRCSLYRYMDSFLHWGDLADKDNWLGAQHVVISSTVTVTALVFAVFIKCPMFSNEQCDKAPYGPVGAARQPHSHASHSPNLFDDGFTVSLVQGIFIPNKTDSHRRHQRTIPSARPYVSCLGRIEGASNIWGSRWFNPKTRYGQKKHEETS